MRYHIEIFRDPHLQRLQDHANAYLEECEKLGAIVEDTALQFLEDEYHLTITLCIPTVEDDTNPF